MGAARQPDQLRRHHCCLSVAPSPARRATADRRAAADSARRRIPPTGLKVEAAPPDLGAALVGRTVLYWWSDDGWQRGTVACPYPRNAFLHVMAYILQTSALRGLADTLLDAASYGSRWVLLSPAPAAGVARALRPRAPRP